MQSGMQTVLFVHKMIVFVLVFYEVKNIQFVYLRLIFGIQHLNKVEKYFNYVQNLYIIYSFFLTLSYNCLFSETTTEIEGHPKTILQVKFYLFLKNISIKKYYLLSHVIT